MIILWFIILKWCDFVGESHYPEERLGVCCGQNKKRRRVETRRRDKATAGRST
ncbi:hypothetical protein NT01EI_3730 [Edwardsiella ictaluri 93-146]|uniref:Uncharacterized protein n=1 Tax=Edwardsiella ictaluri (strain 93-146) TaxID=634503 RepID=C5BB15_EDWI9|nr:hypothetical protein NT01EI_3730 [Edwardsiella ictaluri 93-146]